MQVTAKAFVHQLGRGQRASFLVILHLQPGSSDTRCPGLPPQVHPNKIKVGNLRSAIEGAKSTFTPHISPLGLSPKKLGNDLARPPWLEGSKADR